MAFATRVFCRASFAPSVSALLFWLHQHEVPAVVVGGRSSGDLLSPFWSEIELGYDAAEPPFRVLACHADGDGAGRLREEVADFLEDLADVPPGPARDQVEKQIQATRLLIVIEFPPEGVTQRGYETNGWLMALFVENAGGMVQADGIGFYDEDDELLLAMA